MESFKIGLCQMQVDQSKELNLARAASAIQEAAQQGCQLVALPEMFNCPYGNQYFSSYAETFPGGKTINRLSQMAKENSIYLVGGSIPEQEDGKFYNSSFIFSPTGDMLARHRKVHLFDIDIPDGITFKESDTLSPGHAATSFTTPFGRVGVAICYDIRFPELIRTMTLQGIVLLILPAAFTMVTGPAHWELTMRARALDNQIYVAAISPARDKSADFIAYGHSLVTSPWGEVIVQAAEQPSVLTATIDLKMLAQVRQQLPLLKHRQVKVYQA
ncbi:carbon-nitrogen hydrolase family protein [Desulforamulus aeronauticus]|uniref:Omega-amidase n=1 Tax=Desulforamulus aeronauticus DSM 10349 TaxID=1121421 RepID=A0A1M6WWQ3_9FIRM|nr:carbon-nitrogen hydrolase family protein [Desulforamulus aeronauticus]SHK97989.1 omega-amidase [Desulforamulus aeronauticus DSM 10349]